MPQFSPGQSKNAIVPATVTPGGLSCHLEVFLGPNATTKVATSGLKAFTSTGVQQSVAAPVVMPAATGTYHVYIDLYAAGYYLAGYQATEDVVIAIALTPVQIVANLVISGASPTQIQSAINAYNLERDGQGFPTQEWYLQIASELVTRGGTVGWIYRFRFVGPGYLWADHGERDNALFLATTCQAAYNVFYNFRRKYLDPEYGLPWIDSYVKADYNAWVTQYVPEKCARV